MMIIYINATQMPHPTVKLELSAKIVMCSRPLDRVWGVISVTMDEGLCRFDIGVSTREEEEEEDEGRGGGRRRIYRTRTRGRSTRDIDVWLTYRSNS